MKRYIYAMSMERDRAKKQIAAFSPTIMEHMIKLLVYSDIRPDDIDGWIHTIARSIHNADDITVKPNNKKLKNSDLISSLIGCMGDDVRDYRRALQAFREDNRNGKFNYDDKKTYPDFDITPELSEDLMTICFDVIDKTLPLLTDKQDHSLDEYKSVINQIISKLI